MNALLVNVSGNLEEVYPLTQGTISIGRESDNTIQILDETVSRYHAKIYNLTNICEIEDLQSSNGTFVGGHRIQKATLNHGDEIKIGNIILRFEQVNYEVSDDLNAQSRDYSMRSQHSTIKIKKHPAMELDAESQKKQTAYFPSIRLKQKPS